MSSRLVFSLSFAVFLVSSDRVLIRYNTAVAPLCAESETSIPANDANIAIRSFLSRVSDTLTELTAPGAYGVSPANGLPGLGAPVDDIDVTCPVYGGVLLGTLMVDVHAGDGKLWLNYTLSPMGTQGETVVRLCGAPAVVVATFRAARGAVALCFAHAVHATPYPYGGAPEGEPPAEGAPAAGVLDSAGCTCHGPARDAHDSACPVRLANPRLDLGDTPAAPVAQVAPAAAPDAPVEPEAAPDPQVAPVVLDAYDGSEEREELEALTTLLDAVAVATSEGSFARVEPVTLDPSIARDEHGNPV